MSASDAAQCFSLFSLFLSAAWLGYIATALTIDAGLKVIDARYVGEDAGDNKKGSNG